MGNGSVDCGDARAYDTFEWEQVFGTEISILGNINKNELFCAMERFFVLQLQ